MTQLDKIEICKEAGLIIWELRVRSSLPDDDVDILPTIKWEDEPVSDAILLTPAPSPPRALALDVTPKEIGRAAPAAAVHVIMQEPRRVPASPRFSLPLPSPAPPSAAPSKILPTPDILRSNFRGHRKISRKDRYVPRVAPPPR